MSGFPRVRSLVFVFGAIAAATASPAPAQSLFARSGLGFAADALDARARGLGGVALGLPEFSFALINPAGTAFVPAPALQVTYQPERASAELDGESSSVSTARFPLIHIALPLGDRWAVSLGYGSLFDRTGAVERRDSITIGGETLPLLDRAVSRGGVARFRVGGSRRIGERLAVGVGVDVYTGSVRDSLIREFGDPCLAGGGIGLAPTCQTAQQQFSGVGYTAGARWMPAEGATVAAAVGVGGTLHTKSDEATVADREVDLPTTLAAGASARVATNTVLALSGRWAGWSDTEVVGTESRDAWSVAGGLEWDALSLGEQNFPFRVGARYETLPFREIGSTETDWADEAVVTGGTGALLAGGAARVDLAAEYGSRGGAAAGLSESFWRAAFSVTVFGR